MEDGKQKRKTPDDFFKSLESYDDFVYKSIKNRIRQKNFLFSKNINCKEKIALS